jgi:hypothetical protein
LGDPLERSTESVARDVQAGSISGRCAADIYGVVLNVKGEVDETPTEALRGRIRTARLAAGTVGSTGPVRAADKILDPHYGVLHVAEANGEQVLACAKCRTVAGPVGGDFHEHLASRGIDPVSIGHVSVRADWVFYREYFCRQCGTLVDVTVERN